MSQRPSATAVVVRGGASRSPERLLEKIEMAVDITGSAVLSVFVAEVGGEGWWAAVTEACARADVPHGQVQVSSVGLLEAAGFEIEHDDSGGQASNHFHVLFGNEPGLDTAELFVECFSGPYVNPLGPKKRR